MGGEYPERDRPGTPGMGGQHPDDRPDREGTGGEYPERGPDHPGGMGGEYPEDSGRREERQAAGDARVGVLTEAESNGGDTPPPMTHQGAPD